MTPVKKEITIGEFRCVLLDGTFQVDSGANLAFGTNGAVVREFQGPSILFNGGKGGRP